MLKLKLHYFGHLMWRTDSFEKTQMLEKIEGGRRVQDGEHVIFFKKIKLKKKIIIYLVYLKCNKHYDHHNHQFSHSVGSDSLQRHGMQHIRLPCPSPTPGVYSNSCPSSWWCHPTISSSVFPFSSFLQSFPASGCFPMSQFFRKSVREYSSSIVSIKIWVSRLYNLITFKNLICK